MSVSSRDVSRTRAKAEGPEKKTENSATAAGPRAREESHILQPWKRLIAKLIIAGERSSVPRRTSTSTVTGLDNEERCAVAVGLVAAHQSPLLHTHRLSLAERANVAAVACATAQPFLTVFDWVSKVAALNRQCHEMLLSLTELDLLDTANENLFVLPAFVRTVLPKVHETLTSLKADCQQHYALAAGLCGDALTSVTLVNIPPQKRKSFADGVPLPNTSGADCTGGSADCALQTISTSLGVWLLAISRGARNLHSLALDFAPCSTCFWTRYVRGHGSAQRHLFRGCGVRTSAGLACDTSVSTIRIRVTAACLETVTRNFPEKKSCADRGRVPASRLQPPGTRRCTRRNSGALIAKTGWSPDVVETYFIRTIGDVFRRRAADDDEVRLCERAARRAPRCGVSGQLDAPPARGRAVSADSALPAPVPRRPLRLAFAELRYLELRNVASLNPLTMLFCFRFPKIESLAVTTATGCLSAQLREFFTLFFTGSEGGCSERGGASDGDGPGACSLHNVALHYERNVADPTLLAALLQLTSLRTLVLQSNNSYGAGCQLAHASLENLVIPLNRALTWQLRCPRLRSLTLLLPKEDFAAVAGGGLGPPEAPVADERRLDYVAAWLSQLFETEDAPRLLSTVFVGVCGTELRARLEFVRNQHDGEM